MPWFPMFIQLRDAPVLIAGGGTVALRKTEKLLPYGPRITVVAPDIAPELAALPGLTLCRRPFAESDLQGPPVLVIAATDDASLNHKISALCRERRIPVNVVDDPAACGFLFPALVRRGRLSVGISTGGASPTAAVWLKERIEHILPPHFGAALDRLEALRPTLKAQVPDEHERAARFRAAFERELAVPADDSAALPAGHVALVGAGCGKADLITVRGLRLLRQCTALVYDDLIDDSLLDELPPDAQTFYMGKRSGHHAAPQGEINAKLIELARAGHRVVRLKGGDPFVFGRGGEEALALRQAGIDFEVVPGISSAIAIPGEAGIPVTHRGLSREVHIITAHTKAEEELDYRWYAALEGTLVFLMGLQRLEIIARDLQAGGMAGDTPAAVISGGNAVHRAAVRAPLCEIAAAARQAGVEAPAIIVVGEVAALDLYNGAIPETE